MRSFFRRRFILFPILAVAVLIAYPAVSSHRTPERDRLNLRQRVESLYQNGLRNANSGKTAGTALALSLARIEKLRKNSPKQLPKDEKAMNLRVRELRKMISSLEKNRENI